LVSSVVSGAFFVAGLVLLLVAPSLLAAILIIGAMFGLLIGVAPASIERIARWLSR
jgi:hypothetical protein